MSFTDQSIQVVEQTGGTVQQLEAASPAIPGGDPFHVGYHAANPESLHDLFLLCLRTSDESLWNEFIRLSQPPIAAAVIRTVRRWTKPSPELVDDLVQETYLKLFANNALALRNFVCQHENALYGFIKVVASNVVQDHFRCLYSQKRGRGYVEERIENLDAVSSTKTTAINNYRWGRTGSADVENALDNHIVLQEIDACLKTQSSQPTFSRDYSIFWLYYGEGLTAKAISSMPSIGLSVKGIESALWRLTQFLRLKMGTSKFMKTNR